MLNIIETNFQFKAMNTRKATTRIILHHAGGSNSDNIGVLRENTKKKQCQKHK